jgi:DNA-binding transcriptional LysR family regulator
VPESLRIAYARGVTPGKWARIWGERFPRHPLELSLIAPVTGPAAELEAARAAGAALAFIRLASGEEQPDGVHLIPLYEERPFVVAAKGNVVEAADEVSLSELADELRHPFDDDVESAIEVVAAGVGVVVVPQSLARLYARKDVVARPVGDAQAWRVGLAWAAGAPPELQARIDEFIGVVRGRTANSSRGGAGQADAKAAKPAAAAKAASAGGRRRSAPARPSRAGRSRRRPTR